LCINTADTFGKLEITKCKTVQNRFVLYTNPPRFAGTGVQKSTPVGVGWHFSPGAGAGPGVDIFD